MIETKRGDADQEVQDIGAEVICCDRMNENEDLLNARMIEKSKIEMSMKNTKRLIETDNVLLLAMASELVV